ncbi:P-loop containing nucleoside triphosphate hydrolase protein [Trichoderma evansii]
MIPHSQQKSPMRDKDFIKRASTTSTTLPRHITDDNFAQGETTKHSLTSHYTISRDETSLGKSVRDKLQVLQTAGEEEADPDERGMSSNSFGSNTRIYQGDVTDLGDIRDLGDITDLGDVLDKIHRLKSAPGQQFDSAPLLLQEKVRELQIENESLRERLQQQRENKRRKNFEVFHCISRKGKEETYLEKPYWAVNGDVLQLKAHSLILYPDAYVQYMSPAFIIYRYYSGDTVRATDTTTALRQNKIPDPTPTSEIIRLVSKNMKAALKAFTKHNESSGNIFPRSSENEEIQAPYHWWYYYRNQSHIFNNLSEHQTQLIRNLTSWIEVNYSGIYNRIDDQFERGMVSQASMSFLIRPGDTLVHKDEDFVEAYLAPGQRYMIDYPTYQALHPESGAGWDLTLESKVEATFIEQEAPPEPDIYLLPRTILGFNLRRKKWEDLNVDLIREISWNKDAFKHLVADDDTKDLVQALVTNKVAAERGTDLIQNKGNGLIMLLHGGPGTGKTFTAESVAEMAEKPLYAVTCGDIGTEPEKVEKYLESVFYLGKIWGCIVLLDEAEVFLEQRSLNDLARNALVSVFLRALEYYDGILILTSNRVGTFDEAFKSRIQLSLHYEPLTRPQREKIWRNFFRRLKSLKEDNIDYDDVESYIVELSTQEMNGRQIRNVITTARQWAQFQGRTMTAGHLKYAIKVTSKFDTYIKDVKEGFSDDQIARGDGVR